MFPFVKTSDADDVLDDTPPYVLEAIDLQKTYGRRRVVDGVSLNVGQAEIVGLLGPNGAGKSTSFRMICGMVEPDRGRVYLDGRDVTTWPMFLRARDGQMGYLPQEPSVFKKLTVEQNISALLELLGMDRAARKERTDELLEEFNITHIRKSKAGGLSGGERRRLEIARCLVSNPKIVMLDEPFAGIDPVTVQSIQEVILQLRESGISVLITDHAAREILGTVDRCYVIYQGQVLIDGTPEEVKQHPKVQQEYLGNLDGVDVNSSTKAHGVPSPHFRGARKPTRSVTDV
ncbi:LPS export ABC transporter ATP-binding protein [Rubripirellula amarantea]|uniref:Lipopolysaccharide export system ATP-binding protein LptB n=1 Tax=Rubripirellula amarantea TaxID=2527999 RepID=A0A5C5WXA7_9BACT|nr:LPS export ABC transporter ATP-binding protein [Rubripirellula amarantea]MDA8744912.1 LPS export ABC transporter ATP-binding protein [Rubripirellula amarantea]TWT54741.1 Lipopolysaccharide export system ATP-binding protein LptB [Rubripirellula amarantea]